MGRVSTKVLIAFLADQSVLQDVTLEGHLFQALDASLRKVDCRMSVFPNSTSNPLETALVTQGVVSWLTHVNNAISPIAVKPPILQSLAFFI